MAFFIIALSSGPLVQASEETPKLRATQPQAEPRRKLAASEYQKCKNFIQFWGSDEKGCLAAGCVFFKMTGLMSYRDDVCEPQSWHRPQQIDAWSKEESPCTNQFDDSLVGSDIVKWMGPQEEWISQGECERACRASPGATACEWKKNYWALEYSEIKGESVGWCRFFTDSDAPKIYDCQSVWYDLDEYDMDPCSDEYEGNQEWCMVFGAKVAKSATTCTGKVFKDRFHGNHWKFQGTRVFNCGNKKIKTKCALGCKRGYTLMNDPAGKSVRGGTKSKFSATCVNGVVYHGMLPHCEKKSKR